MEIRNSHRQPLGANYVRLWTASAISNLGDGVSIVVWPWLASLLTRDPFEIALIAAALRLPWLLFSLPAGVITDRFDRKQLVLAMDIARALLFLALAIIVYSQGPYPSTIGEIVEAPGLYSILLVSALVAGMIEVLRDNTAQTLLPSVVPKSRLEAANSRMWAVESLTNSFIGPPLAGFIIAVALPIAFFLDAFAFAISAVLIATLTGNFMPKKRATKNWKQEIREGLLYLWRNPLLRNLAIALGIFNAMYSMLLISLVLFSQETLQLNSTQYGILLTAGAFGGIIGGISAERIIEKFNASWLLKVSLLSAALEMAIISLTGQPVLVWLAMFVGGIFAIIWNTITVSLRQRLIPDELLGRVNSVYRFFGWGMMPLGYLLGGAVVTIGEIGLTRDLALRLPFAFGAAVMILVALYFWRAFSKTNIENAKFQ